jgi:hypothetical protein
MGILFALIAGGATADPLYCSGTIDNLYVEANGELTIRPSYHSNYTGICNILTPRFGIEPQLCVMWFAILHKANADNSPILIQYPNTGTSYTCATLPIYSSTPAPGYVMDAR